MDISTIGTQEDYNHFIKARGPQAVAGTSVTAAAPLQTETTEEVLVPLEGGTQPEATAAVATAPEKPAEKQSRAERRKPLQQAWEREQELKAQIAELERKVAAIAPDKADPAQPDEADAEKQLLDAAQSRIRPKPNREDIGTTYKTYEDYVEDCAIWGGELAAEKRAVLADLRSADQRETERRQSFADGWQDGRKAYPDFDDVINRTQISAPVIEDAIKRQPALSAHLAYWLGTHEAEFARIANLSPEEQFIEIGMLAATIKAERAGTTSAPAKPKTSTAPAPVAPAARAAVSEARLETAQGMEFIRLRNAQIQARRATR